MSHKVKLSDWQIAKLEQLVEHELQKEAQKGASAYVESLKELLEKLIA